MQHLYGYLARLARQLHYAMGSSDQCFPEGESLPGGTKPGRSRRRNPGRTSRASDLNTREKGRRLRDRG
jgi:hypothetical protein